MRFVKFRRPAGEVAVGTWHNGLITEINFAGSDCTNLNDLLESEELEQRVESLRDESRIHAISAVELLPPIDDQEVWAAGVTYRRSQTARMEESAAAASCYDRVYAADRPELFFKATPNRVAGPDQPLRIRADATWNVPEPELALVINSRKRLVGFTIGNDMSSRDIEGENPLYLPQAKLYDDCCGLGPCVTLVAAMPPREQIGIRLTVERNDSEIFSGATRIAEMARSFEELIEYLGRDNSFPRGVILLTGTGIVPDPDFSLLPGDLVHIAIDGIGTLSNRVIQNP